MMYTALYITCQLGVTAVNTCNWSYVKHLFFLFGHVYFYVILLSF